MPIDIKEDKYQRDFEQIEAHYKVEKKLAQRLRHSTKADRKFLYTSLYDELCCQIPDAPNLKRKRDPEATAWVISQRMSLLGQSLKPNLRFLEIGPGDCSLALEVSKHVAQVYAVDVSREITQHLNTPDNFELLISDGSDIPLPEETIDLAYSHQLMEHLHPEDAQEQLQAIYRTLVPGGQYICITPNRLSGPHDISRYFDEIATGFHLKEYTVSELYSLFQQAGFSEVYWIKNTHRIRLRLKLLPLTIFLIQLIETSLEKLPFQLRRTIANKPFLFRGMTIIGTK